MNQQNGWFITPLNFNDLGIHSVYTCTTHTHTYYIILCIKYTLHVHGFLHSVLRIGRKYNGHLVSAYIHVGRIIVLYTVVVIIIYVFFFS